MQIKGEGYLDAAPLGDLIPVFEQSTGFFYKAPARTFGNPVGAQVAGLPRINQNLRTWLGNVSYVTSTRSRRIQPRLGEVTQSNDDVNMNLLPVHRGVPDGHLQRATP